MTSDPYPANRGPSEEMAPHVYNYMCMQHSKVLNNMMVAYSPFFLKGCV